jgi:hypothetical protein
MVSQFSAPIVIEALNGPFSPLRLVRMRPSERGGASAAYAEKLLQELIHAHPSILPVEELEFSFSGLRPICQELPLATGATGAKFVVDNLLANPEGRVCIVECKLWRNPKAVREVVAQILDYAAELAELSYEQMEAAVAKVRGEKPENCLVHAVLGEAATDEQKIAFIEGVSRSLRTGGFLLLIVGDGIRSGLQQIAGLLQNKATLGFSLGLIEMAVYGNGNGGSGPYYVQPRLLLRTETVTRTVFLSDRDVEATTVKEVSQPSKPLTISEEDFLSRIGTIDPSYPAGVSDLIDRAREVGCQPELRRTYVIYAESSDGALNLGMISANGTVTIWGAASHDQRLGHPVGRSYMEDVARLLPGADVKDTLDKPSQWYVRYRGRSTIPLRDLLAHRSDWIKAMARVVQSLSAA